MWHSGVALYSSTTEPCERELVYTFADWLCVERPRPRCGSWLPDLGHALRQKESQPRETLGSGDLILLNSRRSCLFEWDADATHG